MPHTVGIVTFYKWTDDKNFGFALLENGGSVYFNHGKRCEPRFDGGDTPSCSYWINKRVPKKGDRIILLAMNKGEQGWYAVQWAFEDEYKAVEEKIAKRPFYRLMRQSGPKQFGRLMPPGWEPPLTVWEGKDLVILRERYPQSLYPVHDKENSRMWFEVFDESIGWSPITDPR